MAQGDFGPVRKIALGGACLALIAALASVVGTPPAAASIGESFLAIPGIADGRTTGARGWLRVEAHYWPSEDADIFLGRNRLRRDKAFFSGPPAPQHGEGKLALAVDKRSPFFRKLMQACAVGAELPAMRFRESSVRSRGLSELGMRPASVPEFYEYELRQVKFAACPVVDAAPEQAVVLTFKNVALTNYQGPPEGVKLELTPASLRPADTSGRTKAFVVSWFAVANDVSDKQCPVVNAKPTEADYYALKTPGEAARIRAELAAAKDGVGYENEQMAHRGPLSLNVGLLPGIVRDPGHVIPQTTIARGLDLDGDDGRGKPPAGVCRHKNYLAEDGRTGIDNQLYTVQGCMPGLQGHKGFLMQYRNEQRRNGLLSIVVVISGIDDDRNDASVDVTIAYSRDPMAKNADGKVILPDYTYRLTDRAEYAHYFTRLLGRIDNGAIVTDRVPQLQMHPGLDPEVTLYDGGLRLVIQPDGSLKGIAAGYEDWRRHMMINANSRSESLYGFQAPGLYNAFKRYADGLKDPETGECHGISAAYDIEGSAAFVPLEGTKQQIAASAGAARANR
jgi:hypothetical protein